MQEYKLNVELRNEIGKNESNRLRKSGFVPAVIYSHGKSESVKIKRKEFLNLFKGHISESVLIDLNISGKNEDNTPAVFVKDYQLDPRTDELVHVDFYKVTLGEKIHTRVPVEFVGKSAGERMGGILEVMERELEIECLPREMPEKIIIDVTNMKIGESLHVKDIKVEKTVAFLHDDRVVLTIIAPKAIVDEAPAEGEAGADESEQAKTAAEGGDE